MKNKRVFTGTNKVKTHTIKAAIANLLFLKAGLLVAVAKTAIIPRTNVVRFAKT